MLTPDIRSLKSEKTTRITQLGTEYEDYYQFDCSASQRECILSHENRTTTEGYIHSLGNNEVETIERICGEDTSWN